MSRSILVVDDHPDNLYVLKAMLKRQGYAVATAMDGETALEMTKADSYDLILLDVMMPGLDGFEVCQLLHTTPGTSTIPVIFLTALDDDDSMRRGFEVGAVDFITKPFKSFEVLARIATHLNIRAMREDKLRREIEHEKARYEDLQRYTKEVDEILSIAAHDLRNPLAAIISAAEILSSPRASSLQPERVHHMLRSIGTTASGMLGILNDLLSVHMLERGSIHREKKVVDLETVIHALTAYDRERAADKDITVRLVVQPVRVEMYTNSLEPVISNLFSNAVKYTASGGSVAVEASVREQQNKQFLHVAIEDTGPGFTEADKERMYRKFQRLSALPTGGEKTTGLGLAIVRLTVDKCGGSIELRSEAGRGARFDVLLPLLGHISNED